MISFEEFIISFGFGSLVTLLTSLIPIYLKIQHDKHELRLNTIGRILIEIQYNKTFASNENTDYTRFMYESIDAAIKSGGLNLIEQEIIPDLLNLRGEYSIANKMFERAVRLVDSGDRTARANIMHSDFDYSSIGELQDKLEPILTKELKKKFLRIL